MLLQLIWEEPETREQQQPVLETPVALGQFLIAMPAEIDGNPVSRLVLLNDNQIADYHALIVERDGELVIVDQNTRAGTFVNGGSFLNNPLADGDEISIGAYTIRIQLGANITNTAVGGCDRMVGFLFQRRCGRTNAVGCAYCNGGQSDRDPYLSDRSYYPDYGRYDNWDRTYYNQNDSSSDNVETNQVDFTEADAATFEDESDRDFEQDFGAS